MSIYIYLSTNASTYLSTYLHINWTVINENEENVYMSDLYLDICVIKECLLIPKILRTEKQLKTIDVLRIYVILKNSIRTCIKTLRDII